MHLVLIESSGNQRYIFASNKLRENVGASELTWRVGNTFVAHAALAVGLATDEAALEKERALVLASGKALLLTDTREQAANLVRDVTLRALKEAPGLDVAGAISSAFDLGQRPLHDVVSEVHRLFEAARSRRSGPESRFLRLPIVAECRTSGLPAARHDAAKPEPGAYSAVSIAKRAAAHGGRERMAGLLEGSPFAFPKDIEELDSLRDGVGWVSVVHADGNGLGQVFLNFHEHAQASLASDNDRYRQRLRSFSTALDGCTQQAFKDAVGALTAGLAKRSRHGAKLLPVIPLVLGGDDLTVVCDGLLGLAFTRAFLKAFERRTSEHADIRSVMPEGVTACAGVAIVKPHFPFHVAYELAEDLLKSAKKVKKELSEDVSALDFHVLYDASGAHLEAIRRHLTLPGSATRLYGGPYVVSPVEALPDTVAAWETLVKGAATFRSTTKDGRRELPSSQAHWLRAGLFLGKPEADARLGLVKHRYPLLSDLEGQPGSLFRPAGPGHATVFLDALTASEFL